MAELPLYGRGGAIRGHAIVDDGDFAWLSQWRWNLNPSGYATRKERVDGRWRTIRLHRRILDLVHGDGKVGDHKNLNKLDCRRDNLHTLPSEGSPNLQNKPSYAGASSRFRGVSWNEKRKRWQVSVSVGGKNQWIGRFRSEYEANEAAKTARARLMPYSQEGMV